MAEQNLFNPCLTADRGRSGQVVATSRIPTCGLITQPTAGLTSRGPFASTPMECHMQLERFHTHIVWGTRV
jgi:hypothetical protein